ncbi:MAG: DNA primase, partial [Pseudomonadales bacterium]|nr:DNA primase [Pseudomonadales bacterium]
ELLPKSMAGMIPQTFIDDLLARTDLYGVINTRVPLKKAGSNYKACCPFHNEKTPSFNVVPAKNFYHCFGCGANGNAITFLREFDNLSFTEAVEELARHAGMEVPRDERTQQLHRKSKGLLDALKYADQFYRQQLKNHEQSSVARKYLTERGLSTDIIEQFGLGFAPPEWRNLSQNCDPDLIPLLRQLKMTGGEGGSSYDLFRNRVMFPIRNPRGQVIAFGGRTLGDDKAKYINSPESDVFHKSNEVYGLYEALRNNRQLTQLVVVEGYLDVIALAQFGIGNAVATLGTATNDDNLKTLLKHCKEITFCFDGDRAGFKAAQKAMENSLSLIEDGMDLRFLLIPEGEDPDSLIRKEGKDAFKTRLDSARPLSSFFFDVYSQGLDLTLPEDKGKLRALAQPLIGQIQARTLQQGIKNQLYKLTANESPRFFRGKKGQAAPSQPSHSDPNRSARNQKDGYYKQPAELAYKVTPGAKVCLGLYLAPAQAEQVIAQLQDMQGSKSAERILGFAEFIHDQKLATTEQVLAQLSQNKKHRQSFQNLFDSIELFPDAEVAQLEAKDEINQLKISWTEQRIRTLLQEESPLGEAKKQELKKLYTVKQTLKNRAAVTA